ncbi:MAG: peptide-methionine (S)-S-oxide reductase [Opitutaceae bacterium]|mgnify:CR=1 FL=1|nr:peptide-methionine (S)-S-oxide reductase [Opitutaceae bacterium]|tara:strand:+ start:2535 stop:3215 length:681 start_codon:yes stop_codon:yes gene_type:complete
MKNYTILFIAFLTFDIQAGCQPVKQQYNGAVDQTKLEPVEVPLENGLAKAYFASGCFWCVEAVYESLRGVKESMSGYSGGHTQNPTYESSNTGRTGHAEAVEIIYDPEVVSFATLIDVYFGSQNVTQVNGQGPDKGSQYRSIVFYQNDEQKQIIEEKIAALNKELGGEKVAAEVYPFRKFWLGEDYHQDYEKKNPHTPYIRYISIPRLKRFQAKFPHLLKKGHGDN